MHRTICNSNNDIDINNVHRYTRRNSVLLLSEKRVFGALNLEAESQTNKSRAWAFQTRFGSVGFYSRARIGSVYQQDDVVVVRVALKLLQED